MSRRLTVYRVEFPIPEIAALPGDMLSHNAERDRIVLSREVENDQSIFNRYSGHLTLLRVDPEPVRTLPQLARAVPGWN